MARTALAYFLLLPACSLACTRILFNRGNSSLPVLAARTMDWDHPFDDYLLVVPRGVTMDGGLGAKTSKTWTSKYGSVVSSVNGWLSTLVSSHTGKAFDFLKDGGVDGVNEAGLAAHALYLEETQYATVKDKPVGVTYMRWVRYLLDNCATVKEAVKAMHDVLIADVQLSKPGSMEGASLGAHLAIEDASGDSAILEILNGSLVVHHGRTANYTVLANDPPFPQQLAGLKRYAAFGGNESLPGDTTSRDRFVRMSYFLPHVPATDNATVMVGYMKSIINSAAVPYGAPYPGGGTYPTWWKSVVDFQNGLYYWGWTLHQDFLQVNLTSLKSAFADGQETLVLNPRRAALAGDVSGEFKPFRSI